METLIDSGQIQGDRQSQQDFCSYAGWGEDHYLLIMADGIGGAPGGDVASRLAVEGFYGAFMAYDSTSIRDRLLHALNGANNAVSAEKSKTPRLGRMGTTLIGAAIVHDQLYWVSVGDSPLWVITGGDIQRINQDHSIGGLLDMRARAGEITWEEAKKSYERNVLLDAIQGEKLEYIDAPEKPLQLQPGDTVIVASDGVETCEEEELLEIVTSGRPSPSDIVGAILDSVVAHKHSYQDNASLIVVRYH